MNKIELGFFKAMNIKTHLSKYLNLLEILDAWNKLPHGFPNAEEREKIRLLIAEIEMRGLEIEKEEQKYAKSHTEKF